jgi:hypothetical protein
MIVLLQVGLLQMGLPHVSLLQGSCARQWALNSAVECHPHTVEVVGSNPTAPTIHQFDLTYVPRLPGPTDGLVVRAGLDGRSRRFASPSMPASR